MSTLRAAIYARISRDREGAGLGVARQEADCRALADRLGVTVVAVHVDNDLSAYSGKPRPGYRALLDAVRAGAVSVVVCWHTDRLHRSPVELEGWIDAAQAHGVAVHTVKAGPLDLATPSGRMVARQLGAVARYEVEHAIERQKAQKAQAAAQGRYRGGRRPFGYESDGVTVRPAEALIVVEATDRILAGESLHGVARDLNERKIPTSTGREWKPPELRGMLLRARNAGLIEHDGTVVGEACWPGIVDGAAWRSVRRLLTAPGRQRPRSLDLTWLGSGLYRCGVCADGTTMISASTRSTSRGAATAPAYRCRRGSHLTRTAHLVDAFIVDLVSARLSRPDAAGLLAPEAPGIDVGALTERRADLTGQLDEIGRDAVRLRLPLATVSAMVEEAQREIDRIDETIASASAHSPLVGFIAPPGTPEIDVRAVWDAAPVGRRKAVVRVLLEVTLLKAPKGRPAGWVPGDPYFDPRAVQTVWKT